MFAKCRKRAYGVRVYKAPVGTHICNVLEDAEYTTDAEHPYVVTGTRGEQWVISEEALKASYDFSQPGKTAMDNGIETVVFTRIDMALRWCELRPLGEGPFSIDTGYAVLIGNRPEIDHLWGDFVMASDDNGAPSSTEQWIVNGRVFFDTYQLVEE